MVEMSFTKTRTSSHLFAGSALSFDSSRPLDLAAQHASDGLWVWDLTTGVVSFSPRWWSMLGYDLPSCDTGAAEWFTRVHPEDLMHLMDNLQMHLEGHTSHVACEYRILARDGNYRWVLCRGQLERTASGQPIRMAGAQTDISMQKALECRLQHETQHDRLTGLPNRALFLDRVQRAVFQARRHENVVAVLFLDLDDFKMINEGMGHAAGDHVLVLVSHRLEACLRESDLVARLGGDEWAILLRCQREGDLMTIVERIQQAVQAPIALEGQLLSISVSVGVTVCISGYERPEEMLRDAEIAMHRAKEQGRARYTIFDPSMHAQVMTRLQLVIELRRALAQGEFEVYYQPIVSLENDLVRGFEALIRWNHPHRGLLGPGEFFSIAEETGLSVPIGEWMFKQVCYQLRAWQVEFPQYPPMTVSVNVSNKQFWNPEIVEQIDAALRESGIAPACLRLEITEDVFMDQAEAALEILQQLRELSIELHVDDFGTGYSSLHAVHTLPITALKIDRSFISRMETDPRSRNIVQTIVMLGIHLGLEVIAEGIETEAQRVLLCALRCSTGQGYLFAKPLQAKAVRELIAHS